LPGNPALIGGLNVAFGARERLAFAGEAARHRLSNLKPQRRFRLEIALRDAQVRRIS
jgi:hypothetical protein